MAYSINPVPACIVYIATSLDGYIADAAGGLEWLTALPAPGAETEFEDLMGRVDAVLMGRVTFETVLGFGAWPYAKPVYVLSDRLAALPPGLEGKAELVRGPARAAAEALHGRGVRRLYVDGGATVRSFLREDLVDELTLTTAAVLLGGGVPLFGELARPLDFRWERSRALGDRLVMNVYRRVR